MYEEATLITQLYLYGQASVPENPCVDRSSNPQSIYTTNLQNYMENGGGRFAVGAQFELINSFFTADKSIFSLSSYTPEELAHIFSLSTQWNMQQRFFSDSVNDYAERVYIYNSQTFKIVDEAVFIVGENESSRRIENFSITPLTDNFDFTGGTGWVVTTGNAFLKTAIDPANIGKTVFISFTEAIEKKMYDQSNFLVDLARVEGWKQTSVSSAYLLDQIKSVVHHLYASKTIIPGVKCLLNALSWGDPHLVIWKGFQYDHQIPGEYLLVGSSSDDFQMQVRQELMSGSNRVSLNTAVATNVNSAPLGLYVLPKITHCLQGTSGNDVLQGGGTTSLILGAEDSGQVTITTGGEMTFIESRAEYRNTFGYYVADENGHPSYGKIVWANAQATARGNTYNYGLDVLKENLGFFMITNGASHNGGLADGDAVTFQQVNGAWAALKNNAMLTSEYTNAPVFFSDVALNSDHIQHQRFIDNVQYWEDMYGGGDMNYSDVIFGTSINEEMTIAGGDILIGSENPESFGYVVGKDGVDTLYYFNASNDKIIFYDANQNNMKFIDVNGGTFIKVTSSTETNADLPPL